MNKEKNIYVSFQMPKEIKEQAASLAKSQDRSLSNLILVAIKEYITKYSQKGDTN